MLRITPASGSRCHNAGQLWVVSTGGVPTGWAIGVGWLGTRGVGIAWIGLGWIGEGRVVPVSGITPVFFFLTVVDDALWFECEHAQ